MKKVSRLVLAGAIAFTAYGSVASLPVAQAAEQQSITSFVKDNGGTISLKLVNNTDVITYNKIYVQELRDGQWVEPDYNTQMLELYPDLGWNYDTAYFLKGDGGDLPSKGTFKFKIETTNANGDLLETSYSDVFTIN